MPWLTIDAMETHPKLDSDDLPLFNIHTYMWDLLEDSTEEDQELYWKPFNLMLEYSHNYIAQLPNPFKEKNA